MNKEIVKLIEERLEKGKREYADQLDPWDGRDWSVEALEELLDGMVYLASAILKLKDNKTDHWSSGILRAYEIWESIDNGDSLVYEKTEFSDIEDLLDISPTEELTNYEIETYMNRCFLDAGYKWIDDGNDNVQLAKSKEKE